jgi:hypothetical protein
MALSKALLGLWVNKDVRDWGELHDVLDDTEPLHPGVSGGWAGPVCENEDFGPREGLVQRAQGVSDTAAGFKANLSPHDP